MVDATDAGRDEEGVRRFIERFALDLSEAGMPRMPARAFAAILSADDGRSTAADHISTAQLIFGSDTARQ